MVISLTGECIGSFALDLIMLEGTMTRYRWDRGGKKPGMFRKLDAPGLF